ncbi:MAG: hypothetical protein EAZ24_07410 [Burkholderiales bacterium]|nr:MAG: hypothetical protein EAZ24_07410 [Burkholderiales bacterium]TAG81938.1 MAG: hypothetical protein EAZ21_04880 [Betaproteobacteria bacterium]
MKRNICDFCKNSAVSVSKPWFERVMDERRDPVWVAFSLFFVPSAFLNMAMFIVAAETISRA